MDANGTSFPLLWSSKKRKKKCTSLKLCPAECNPGCSLLALHFRWASRHPLFNHRMKQTGPQGLILIRGLEINEREQWWTNLPNFSQLFAPLPELFLFWRPPQPKSIWPIYKLTWNSVNMSTWLISSSHLHALSRPFTLQEIRFYQPLLRGPPPPSDHLHICGHQRGPAERYPVPKPSLKIISEVNHLSCFDRIVWLMYRIFCEDISDLPIVSTLNV